MELLQLYFTLFLLRSSMTMRFIGARIGTIIMAVLMLQVMTYQSNYCFKGCQTCEILIYFIYCTQCFPNRILDSNTGLCPCRQGMYEYAGMCVSCPNNCLTCNQFSCTSCTQDKYYINGNCVCKNGR
jgi:hypothetical protein